MDRDQLSLNWLPQVWHSSSHNVFFMCVQAFHFKIENLFFFSAPDQTEFTFTGLMPSAEYTFSVYTLGQDEESSPLVVNAVTSKDLTFPQLYLGGLEKP